MAPSPDISDGVRIECAAMGRFHEWTVRSGGPLAVSTYQAGKVATIGFDRRQPTLLTRQFDKHLGMAVNGGRLTSATRHELTSNRLDSDSSHRTVGGPELRRKPVVAADAGQVVAPLPSAIYAGQEVPNGGNLLPDSGTY